MKLPKITIGQKPTYIKFAKDVDFYQLFEKIERQFSTCFILESLGEEGHLSRYSIIGFDPKHIIRARGKTLFVDDKAYEVENPYFALREMMPDKTIARSYAGGLIGYLGYDAVNYFEPALQIKEHFLFDQFMFGVYTDGLILDKMTDEIIYFYYDENRLEKVRDIMKLEVQPFDFLRLRSGQVAQGKRSKFKVIFLTDTMTKKKHGELVRKAKKEIAAGNTFQCQIGFASEFTTRGNPMTIYDRLRRINPSPFMYYLKFGQKKIIGASPELLFRLQNGEMATFPLAGTIKRGKNEAEDKQLARKILSDEKEIAEHNMLVDLHRNDLGRVARFGTVKVRSLMDIKRFSHVQHISSEIVSIIRQDKDMFDALAANFPTGTLSGAPKIESMKIIDRLEKRPRGPYGGGVGHFGFNGDCTFAIAIRSLFMSGDYAYTQASGGIVYDSKADNEYEEVQNKLAAVKEALK